MIAFVLILFLAFSARKSTSFRPNSLNIAASGSFHRKTLRPISRSSTIRSSLSEDPDDGNDSHRDVINSNDSNANVSSETDDESSEETSFDSDHQTHRSDTTSFGDVGDGDEGGLGEYNPSERLPGRRQQVLVGEPQKKVEKEYSVSSILKELVAIQEQGPQKYCVLGTRHCSYLHQRIIELLAYALVLSGNHVYTSGAGGTHAATIRGALRAERPDLLTVVLPQSLSKQPKESQELLMDVNDIIEMPENDKLSLDIASRICNSYMLSCTDHLVSFAFHESKTVIEATREARDLDMLVTTLYLD